MKKNITVTFIQHSGFLVETETSYLLFDYWKGTIPSLLPDKDLYVFASHFHHDHYTKAIFDLNESCRNTYYIMSDDIRRSSSYWKQVSNYHFMKPRDVSRFGACHVQAFDSTDEGVAFLVDIDGWVFFHAGDLHWWDWPGEPEEENRMMEKRYCAEIDLLRGRKIDAAFIVLDPRQEESGGLGMDYFVSHIDAGHIFPMHCWEDYGYIRNYYQRQKSLFRQGQFMLVQEEGQTFKLEASDIAVIR